MRVKRYIVGFLALAPVAGLVVYLRTVPGVGTVPYHLKRFNQLRREFGHLEIRNPTGLRDYCRPATLHWLLRGKPTLISEWEQEQSALLNLGCFERREVILTNRQLGLSAWRDGAVSNAVLGANNPWVVYMDNEKPTWIRVTGTNLDAFETIIRKWDTREAR